MVNQHCHREMAIRLIPLKVEAAGRIPKWPTGADCKSAGLRLRQFESDSYHHLTKTGKSPDFTNVFSGSASISIVLAVRFQALRGVCVLLQYEV